MQQQREVPPPPPAMYALSITQNGSFMSNDSKRTNLTKQSNNKKASAQEQAAILSAATSQATAAANSILASGGTEDTALITARAAAESILIPNSAKFTMFANKRQALQQAQVIASMALIAAQATGSGNSNIFMRAPSAASRKPPSVIGRDAMQHQRGDELSSVGANGTFTDGESLVERQSSKNLTTRSLRSNASNHSTTTGPMKLPPIRTHSPPKNPMTGRKKLTPTQQPLKVKETKASQKEKVILKVISPVKSDESNSLVMQMPARKKARDETSNSKDSYFARRREREQQKLLAVNNNVVNTVSEEDPVYNTVPQLDLVEEPSSTLDVEERSASQGHTDDEDEEKSVSSDDAFEDVTEENRKPKKRNSTFGTIVDGMLCGACSMQTSRPDYTDDMSRDVHSQYSDHTDHSDESSHDGADEYMYQTSPRRWESSKSSRDKKMANSTTIQSTSSRKLTPNGQEVVLPQQQAYHHDRTPLTLEPVEIEPTKPAAPAKRPGRKKAEIKRKIKESMEKVVLRAMAVEGQSITRNESLTSNAEQSAAANSTYSKKSTFSRSSRGGRLAGWMRRKTKK